MVEQIAKTMFPPTRIARKKIYADIMRREEIVTQVYAEFGFALLHNRSEGVVRPTPRSLPAGKVRKDGI